MRTKLTIILLALLSSITIVKGDNLKDKLKKRFKINERDSLYINRVDKSETIHKGEYMLGLAASVGNITSEDSEILLILEDIDAEGTIASVNPSFGYFYNDHSLAGVRFKYTKLEGKLNTASLDLGSGNDVDLDIPYVDIKSTTYSYGLFQRSYAKLDKKGQFELFSELELLYSHGKYDITNDLGGDMKTVVSKTNSYSLNFNPGLAVYIFPNAATYVSLGLGGISYNKVRQFDENGKFIGERTASKLNVKLNLFAINFGIAVHLW